MRRVAVWMSKMGRWAKDTRPFRYILTAVLHSYLLGVSLIGFFALLSAFPSFRIAEFLIIGNSAVNNEAIITTIEETLRHPFAFIVRRDVPLWAPQESIAASVYAIDSHVYNVAVSGRFSRTLSVVITEEKPAMLWCGNSVPTSTNSGGAPCWFANEHGTIFAKAPEYLDAPYLKFYTTPAPIFNDPYPRSHEYPLGYVIADRTTMNRLQSLSDALPERGYQVSAMGVTNDADVVVFTQEGTRFLFGLSRNILEDMKRLEALREALLVKNDETVLSEIDLRFATKIYFH